MVVLMDEAVFHIVDRWYRADVLRDPDGTPILNLSDDPILDVFTLPRSVAAPNRWAR